MNTENKFAFSITVSEVVCPVCGAPEVNEETGLLNIRGYKVADKHGWWSQCLLAHDMTLDGEDISSPAYDLDHRNDGGIWFVDSEVEGKVIVDVPFVGRAFVFEQE